MRPVLVAHAPTRLDFGGGWTDVPPYPEERGGFVCNVAIERRATARLAPIHDSAPGLRAGAGSALAAAACSVAQVANAQVTLLSDFPVGAGLGGSSAAGVALAAALARWTRRSMTRSELAEWSREVEIGGLQLAGGRQDHYAAAYGGALGLTFEASVQVEQLALDAATVAALEARCLLLYTGESRISGETITAVLEAYATHTPRVVNALDRMRTLAVGMAGALRSGDVDTLGALVGEHWHHQRALHPRIATERIDAIADAAARAGAIGMKALGASGGGCVVIVAPAEGIDRVADAVAPLGERLAWRVAHTGVDVREEPPLPEDTGALPESGPER